MPKWKRGEKGIGWQKRRTEDNHNYPAVDTKAVESLLAQLAGAEAGWMDDPAFIRWLAKRNEQVSAELQKGEYATLKELQEKWARKESAK